jgi:hypothetical protein
MSNPLMPYFRNPALYIKLPSEGKFMEANEIKTTMTGEIPVYPMTASDEIILKNPDALLNGDAIVRVVKSCLPDILDPRSISVPDLDVILLAIKQASFGDSLDMDLKCPECGEEMSYALNIRSIIDNITPMNIDNSIVRINDDVVVYLRPYNLESKTILDMATFEENMIFKSLLDSEMDESEKAKIFNQSFERIADMNLELIAKSIMHIDCPMPEGSDPLTYKDYVEFIKNTDRKTVKLLKDALAALSDSGVQKEVEVTCTNVECQHTWNTPLVYDASSFFA